MRMAGTPGYPEVHADAADSSAAPPVWAAATFAPEISSPSSRTCAARARDPTSHSASSMRRRFPYRTIRMCAAPGSFSMRGHSVGGYGSVTTNKVIATIAGEVFGMDVQAYPKYGSEKKGLPTTYYLTIAKEHIRVHSELEHVEFIPLNDVNAFNLENPLAGLSQNGMVFVQSQKTDPAEVWAADSGLGAEGTG